MSNFIFFWDGIFSNWHPSKFTEKLLIADELKDVRFTCAEQYLMAQKAIMFDDMPVLQKIMGTDNPRTQKALGRSIKTFDADKWAEVREEKFYPGLLAKYDQNPDLRKILLDTGDKIIVEASPYDTVWGIGMGENDPGIEDPANWKGLNVLGEMIMQVRTDLRKRPPLELKDVFGGVLS